MNNQEQVKEWTFLRKSEPSQDIINLLVKGEEVFCCYKTVRDMAALTNKRIIIMDKQGITGKKAEIFSLPFRSIDFWSTENQGLIDMTAELELWTKVGRIKISFNKNCDIREFDKIMSAEILENE